MDKKGVIAIPNGREKQSLTCEEAIVRKSNLISTELVEICHYEFPFFWKRSNPYRGNGNCLMKLLLRKRVVIHPDSLEHWQK